MNEDTIAGKFEEVKGKVKQAFGEATGDQSTANSGTADQVKGNAQQTWGNTKDAASDVVGSNRTNATQRSETAANETRDNIASKSENLKDKVSDKLEDFKERHSN